MCTCGKWSSKSHISILNAKVKYLEYLNSQFRSILRAGTKAVAQNASQSAGDFSFFKQSRKKKM